MILKQNVDFLVKNILKSYLKITLISSVGMVRLSIFNKISTQVFHNSGMVKMLILNKIVTV